jgi:peptide/nickel transport system substrate-binding protein
MKRGLADQAGAVRRRRRHTFRVDSCKKDRLTVPDLAVIVPCVINSELVKKNATERTRGGSNTPSSNTAGSGAYKVTNWTAGTEVVYERNDGWKGGPLPKVKRIIWRMVPHAGNRRALLERGDADISYDLPNKDFAELKNHRQAQASSRRRIRTASSISA